MNARAKVKRQPGRAQYIPADEIGVVAVHDIRPGWERRCPGCDELIPAGVLAATRYCQSWHPRCRPPWLLPVDPVVSPITLHERNDLCNLWSRTGKPPVLTLRRRGAADLEHHPVVGRVTELDDNAWQVDAVIPVRRQSMVTYAPVRGTASALIRSLPTPWMAVQSEDRQLQLRIRNPFRFAEQQAQYRATFTKWNKGKSWMIDDFWTPAS